MAGAVKRSFSEFRNLSETSRFRILYIVTLFFCYVSFLQVPAYVCLFFLYFWGVKIAYRSVVKRQCLSRLRFGFWILLFLGLNIVTMIAHFNMSSLLFFTVSTGANTAMFLHMCVCFFVFYGMHTEREVNTKAELYTVCKFIIYATSILGVIGFVLLFCGFTYESGEYIHLITYEEERFTGVYFNPNMLGFISIVSVVCCHMVSRQDFLIQAGKRPISKIWISICLLVGMFSILLCDSNASMILFICYVITVLVFNFFSMTANITKKQLILKLIALIFACIFVVFASFWVRSICQEAFSTLLSSSEEYIEFGREEFDDSGRFALIEESIGLFQLSPVIGISSGNIIPYSQQYVSGHMRVDYHHHDLHNGYLTLLVSTGIIGFCIFAIFGIRFAKHIAKNLFKRQNALSRDILPCLFAFCCAYLVYTIFERALLYDVSFMVMWFWYMVGCTSVYLNKYEPLKESYYVMERRRLPRHML